MESTEEMIQKAGKTAPRVTPIDIENNIVSEHYFTAADGYCGALSSSDEFNDLSDDERVIVPPCELELLTFCVLVLRNGFTVTGESACASPENFDEDIGRKIARQAAVAKLWPLMGYELKCRLDAQ